jgi:hypothetical protein
MSHSPAARRWVSSTNHRFRTAAGAVMNGLDGWARDTCVICRSVNVWRWRCGAQLHTLAVTSRHWRSPLPRVQRSLVQRLARRSGAPLRQLPQDTGYKLLRHGIDTTWPCLSASLGVSIDSRGMAGVVQPVSAREGGPRDGRLCSDVGRMMVKRRRREVKRRKRERGQVIFYNFAGLPLTCPLTTVQLIHDSGTGLTLFAAPWHCSTT